MHTDRSRTAPSSARSMGARTRFARTTLACSSLAIAVVLTSAPARAQSFQGAGTVVSGSATIGTATNVTTISNISTDAVIDWTTFDTATGGGAINFQPSGTTATFSSSTDFSVLNRIIPTDPSRAVQFNGNVIAQIQGTSPVPGGSVYFYSPGGVIVGATAVFNVGNLGLTSIAPAVVGGVFEQPGAGGEFVQFNGAVTPGSAVSIQAGAQIMGTAPGGGSYLAVVAPRINNRGTISGKRVSALVSADAATITFNPNGLFDIQVTSGTSATGTTLSNGGSITGPAGDAGNASRLYMVAVPKNTAITLAVAESSAQLGFDIADAADVVGNAVILSGGHDIVAGEVSQTRSAGAGTGLTTIFEGSGGIAVGFTSDVRARSDGLIQLGAFAGTTLNFAANINAHSDTQVNLFSNGATSNLNIAGNAILDVIRDSVLSGGNASIGANNFGAITIGGNVILNANRTGNGVNAGVTQLSAISSGTLNINGSATLFARGIGSNGVSPGNFGGNATGGVAVIQATTGGDVAITGPVIVNASATGGNGNAAGGGSATGGLAQIFARDAGSTVTITGTSSVLATGSAGLSQSGFTAGFGTGGQAIVNAQVAASNGISISGATNIDASGFGGSTTNSAAGIGTGGTASVAVSDNNTVQFGSTLDIFASGQGGTTTNGSVANGNGGTARLNLFNNGTLTINGNTQLFATGLNGNGNPGAGVATGGTVGVTSQNGSILDINGFLIADAGGLGNGSLTAPGSGFGVGGNVTVAAFTNGSIDVSGVLRARAPGVGANGSTGTGGTVTVSASSGGDLIANELNILATARGGANTGNGGNATGGTANLIATGAGSTLTITNGNSTGLIGQGEQDFVSARSFGGQASGSGVGGTATGGTVNITASAGATLTGPATPGTQSFLSVFARGFGGNANTGATAGGRGVGGTINITVDNATMTSANLLPSAFALGGSFVTGATGNIAGGNATGGSRNINVINGGSLTTSFNGGTAGGSGGNGLGSGAGGNASAGSANLTVDNGSTLNLTGPSIVFAGAAGGIGGATGASGSATAGNAFTRIANGSTLTMAGPATNLFTVSADGTDNFSSTASATGSNSTGGNATFVIENATANLQTVTVSANGVGGGGLVAQGGNGTGGTATLQLIGATLNADTVTVTATGFGGSLDIGQSGVAGNGRGGFARIDATGAASTATVAQSVVIGADGLGGDIGGAAGTTTGNGVGGTALLFAVSGGSLTLNAPIVELVADGEGGEVVDGSADFGGDGTGGLADVFVSGGNLTINGNLFLEADNDGGEGILGGDGLRRTDGGINARLAATNGNITVNGTTALASVGTGGIGANASGGIVIIDPRNSLAGPSTITLNGLVVDAIAVGGQGMSAPSPTSPGGAGGAAFGGSIQLLGSAGNGRLVVNGDSFLDTSAFGGTGGTGHPGATGTAGGRGGDATGGNIQFGTKSGADTGAINTGSAQFGAVQASSNAFGGTGGVGGSGTTQGNGGAGGDAFNGGVTLLVRGSPVTLTALATLNGNATGGNGGAGAIQGAGGNATVGGNGGVAVLATSRFMQPTQLGTLTAPSVFGTATASGGAGSTAGAANIGNQPLLLQFDGASGTIGDIFLDVSGGALANAAPSLFSLTNGQLDIGNSLVFQTAGTMTVALDRFTVNVPNLALRANNVVLPATLPVSAGTFNVTQSLDLRSDLDFVTYANFNVPFDTSFSWLGDFQVGNFTGGNLFVEANGSITIGNIVGDRVELFSDEALSTGVITASDEIELDAGGAATTGQLTAGAEVIVSALGAITVAGASAGIVDPSTSTGSEYNIGLRSLTSIVAGDLAARGSVGVASPGTITVGNVTTGPGPNGLGFLALAGTGLTTGSIDTTASSGGGQVYIANFSMESLGGQIGDEFDPAPIVAATPVAIGGPVAINGSVSTGTIRANTLESLAISGPITATGASVLIGGQSLTTGNLTAGNLAIFASGGALTLGNVDVGLAIAGPGMGKLAIGSTAGPVNTGTLSAAGDLGIQTGGSISTGALRGRDVLLLAGGAVATGAVIAGPTTQPGRFYIGNFSMAVPNANVFSNFATLPIFGGDPLATGGPIAISGTVDTGNFRAASGGDFTIGSPSATLGSPTTGGTVTAAGEVELVSGGALLFGDMTSRSFLDFESAGTLTGGNLTASDAIGAQGAGSVTLGNLSGGLVNPVASDDDFSIGVISTGGSTTVGNVAGRDSIGIIALAGNLTTGNLDGGGDVLLLASDGVNIGSITSGATGRTLIANSSMISLGGPLDSDSFTVEPIFAATPVPVLGAISISGPVITGTFKAATTQDFTSGSINAATIRIMAGLGITTGALTASDQIDLIAGASLSFGDITTGGGLFIDSGSSLTTGNVQARQIDFEAAQGITTGTLSAMQGIVLEAGNAVQTGAIAAGGIVDIIAGGALTTGNITAGPDPENLTSIALSGGSNVTTGTLSGASNIELLAKTGSIATGAISTGKSLLALARGAVNLGQVSTGTTVNDFTYIANSSMVLPGGPLANATTAAQVFAATPVATTGPITIANGIATGNLIAATTAALSIGGSNSVANISVPGEVRLSGSTLTLANITAGTDITLTSSGALAGGNLTAGDAVLVMAAGPVALGTLSAGLVNPSTASGATLGVGVRSSGGSVMVGRVSAARDVSLLAGGGSLTANDISAGRNVLLLARDSASLQGIAAATTGQIYIASSTMSGQAGSLDNINPGIFGATPVPLSGAIAIDGPVTGTTFTAAANGNFTAGNLTLGQRITLGRAATAQVNGAWVAPTISLASQRLAFGTATGAGIGGSGTTSLTLNALASGQTAVLGGTTAGMGYSLTQSDFGRIRSSNLTIKVDQQGVGSTAPDLEIRDLTLNGSGMSGGLSSVSIGTPGRARITGDLLLQQAGEMDRLTVSGGQRLEIVLPDASVAVTGTGGALAGTLTLSSNNLVAGTLDLLMQVMADPEAAGLAEALAAPASTTPNLEGYIRANGVSLISNANLLLQNSGTARDFAGVTVGGGGLIIGRITPATSGSTSGTTGGTTGGTSTTSGFSFTGMLIGANDVLMFQFQVDANSSITLRTYSYAGGTNAAGQVIPAGGFDPILALFDSAGALIGQNDDGGSNVPADPTTGSRFDTFFQPPAPLAAGTYTVTVSVFPNFAVGPNLSNGFENDATSFGSRTADFAFDVLGASVATGPGTQTPSGPSGPLNVIGFGRQLTATGSVTGQAFFSGINFGTTGENPLVYSSLSQFNTCLVNGGTCLAPPVTIDPVASISSEVTLAVANQLADAPTPAVVEESADSATESASEEATQSAEEEDEAEAEAASPIAPPAPLINTRPLNPAVNVVEPVAGAGNPALIGSAVNEATAQGDTP